MGSDTEGRGDRGASLTGRQTETQPRDQTGNKWWRSESQRLRPRFQHSVYPLASAGGVRRRRPTVSKILLSFSHHGPSICWALGSPPSHGLILAYRTYILWSLSSFHLPSLNEGFSSTIISYLMVMVVSPVLLRDGSTSGRTGETRWPKGTGGTGNGMNDMRFQLQNSFIIIRNLMS